jgi:hypothetical protein
MGLVRKYLERRYERMSPEEKAAADAEMHRRTQIAETQIEAAHAAQAASVAAQEQSRAEHQDNVLFARMHLKTGARRVIADESRMCLVARRCAPSRRSRACWTR